MGAVVDYLQENYLHEQIIVLDESIASWLKNFNIKNLINKFDSAVKKKDPAMIETLLKVIPKTDFRTLYTIGSKVDENFSAAFDAIKKEAGTKFSTLKGMKLDLFSLIISTTIVMKPDLKKASKDVINDISTKLKKVGVKHFSGDALVGLTLLILSGVLVSATLASLSMDPLIWSIAIVGLAMLVFMR